MRSSERNSTHFHRDIHDVYHEMYLKILFSSDTYLWTNVLIHWGPNKIASILQSIFLYIFELRFHWSFFPGSPIDNKAVFVHIVAWHKAGDMVTWGPNACICCQASTRSIYQMKRKLKMSVPTYNLLMSTSRTHTSFGYFSFRKLLYFSHLLSWDFRCNLDVIEMY